MSLFTSILNILKFNRRNWKAVVLCLIAATVFWFLNALNKTYTTNLNFPLTFNFDQENFVAVKSLPGQIRLNVTGNGWDLFKRSTGVKMNPLEFPLERPADVKKIVGGNNLQRIFANQVDDLEINFVLTDTLYLDLEPKVGRWVNVSVDSMQLHIRNGFTLASDITTMPDSIFIEGPARLVDAFEEPVLITLTRQNIDEPFMDDVEVKIPAADLIRRDPPTVAVMFDVERLITLEDSVLISVENIPSTVANVEQRYIPITVLIPENQMEGFSMDSVQAVLDLSDFTRGEAVIFPEVRGLPQFTRIIKLDSVRIKL